MYYRHDRSYDYPQRSDEHMITVKHLRDVSFDTTYPYLQKGFWFGCKRVLCWLLVNGVLSWLVCLTHGLRIYGRENLKKDRKAIKKGVISVANHVFMWDFICVMKAMRPRLGYFPAWAPNMEGPNGPLIRMAGGIPVPTESLRAMVCFKKALEEVLATDKWVHFFPEGSMWFYYPDIRPIKKAAFGYAVTFNRPILPMSFSFRPRKGIMKWFGKAPLVDLHIGELLYPDASLGKNEAARDLQARTYHVMQEMSGIHPGDPTYNTDLNIDTYQKTM